MIMVQGVPDQGRKKEKKKKNVSGYMGDARNVQYKKL